MARGQGRTAHRGALSLPLQYTTVPVPLLISQRSTEGPIFDVHSALCDSALLAVAVRFGIRPTTSEQGLTRNPDRLRRSRGRALIYIYLRTVYCWRIGRAPPCPCVLVPPPAVWYVVPPPAGPPRCCAPLCCGRVPRVLDLCGGILPRVPVLPPRSVVAPTAGDTTA